MTLPVDPEVAVAMAPLAGATPPPVGDGRTRREQADALLAAFTGQVAPPPDVGRPGAHRDHGRQRRWGLAPGGRGAKVGVVSRSSILDIPVSGVIRLGQFLKLAGLAEDGGHARALIEAGEVQLNGRTEQRRGAQLAPGDVVAVGDRRARPIVPG